jgi:di/tricarboxylate transporter
LDPIVRAIFVVVYIGMMVGRLPGFAMDRTGVVLVGAIAMIATDQLTARQAWDSVDIPTIGMLFGLMIVSAVRVVGVLWPAHRAAGRHPGR